jgi:hypothetical protein
MKSVLSALTFSIAALLFVIFLTVVKPGDFSVAAAASEPLPCESEAALLHVCRPHFFPGEAGASAPSE